MNTSMERINLKAFEGQQLVKAYISPDHLTEGFAVKFKVNTMLFLALTWIGFAHGNRSYRVPCPTGTFVPPLKRYKPSNVLELKCIPCPPGGFYSDGIAVAGQNCFPCNNGTYVPPERAPGKSVLHCIVCPTGKIIAYLKVKPSLFDCTRMSRKTRNQVEMRQRGSLPV
ncbi:PREDICTED: uncharacterized protein LOC107355695 [Acropora digitifera]|uniref:uncharacterized protein LOC107355694 n=1 Tax=Acropora digitifera TaxID=70779 RepID=UPI00077A1A7F|nr:PREDICTED: uncharacterized protein LOC107355694 [Acropora digitifera]XP_015777763.1 PREDICTED: uncharacterized protein LOC107355695 [Acropora digitifera]